MFYGLIKRLIRIVINFGKDITKAFSNRHLEGLINLFKENSVVQL